MNVMSLQRAPLCLRPRFYLLFLMFLGSLRLAPGADPFAENVRSTPWQTPEDERKSFRLPPGFELQLVASEPDLFKPMNLAFDARGRLWVTVTQEYPYPAPTNRPARDAIKILEDTDGDGRADKITTFAEGLNIPIGIYPYKDGCVVWSIPNLWLLRDTDGDGKADRREVLYGPFDHTRDTHGNQASFRRGFDGWLYCTHGYNNDSHVRGADGNEVHLNSGNTYRIRLDGSRIEHYTHGQVNPFGLAYDPFGNLFSSDCHSAPIYQLLAGAYYPSFGKPDDGLGFAPMTVGRLRGSTALDGISYYADALWPEEFRDNIFVGDVMSSTVMRDYAEEIGGSKFTRPRPDFVTTTDPWFRPVDTQLGPDGALYIADFYNRIIGHYEVPLNHPGRDRTSGRIWRVVYRGSDGKLKVRPPRDLSKLSAEQLVAALADPNLTYRRLASDQLADRIGQAAVPALKKSLGRRQTTPTQRAQALWVLQRLGATDDKMLTEAARHPDRLVRVHAMRLLTDRSQLSPKVNELAVAGLKDTNGLVQRCAAEALAAHPKFENIAPLLAFRHTVSEKDTHLTYVARKAVRDQLVPEENFRRLAATKLDEADAQLVADVATGIPSAPAGAFLITHVQKAAPEHDKLVRMLRHAVRYAPEANLDGLAEISRNRFAGDTDLQLSLLQSIQQGLDQRGAKLSPGLSAWATDLAGRLLASVDPSALTWVNFPTTAAGSPNPWFLQRRVSADGDKNSLFLCSLPPGGESLTGILRSKAFVIPEKLTFWFAGHDGYPNRAAQGKNHVALRLVDGQVVKTAAPPRNDTAQKVTWELSAHAGKQGYLDLRDGDDDDAYAWIAAGRFEPPVVPLPAVSPNTTGKRQQAAAELAARLRLANLEAPLTTILTSKTTDPETRAAVARALVTLNPTTPYAPLAPLLGDVALTLGLRTRLGEALTEKNPETARTILVELLRDAPQRAQVKLAQALVGNAEGSDTLLRLIAEGKASPRLLLDRSVKDKLLTSRPADGQSRVTELTRGLTPVNQELEKLVEKRRDGYRPSRANPVLGAEVFTRNCSACHSVDGRGGNIGPQLDGIGTRGLERLCEDVLDPNRNVDRAFRSTLLVLSDGDVVSGLYRRDEGELIVLADSTGKENTVPRKSVTARRESETSLMPENFGDLLTPEDFNNLMGFLLSKGAKGP